ncbi:MAG: APC family permease [Actinobacteria bacterium]|nr:APC family permease [Actinomycetota bacterium]MBO0785317.1 APC family permease [Actinomycetota bacterium]
MTVHEEAGLYARKATGLVRAAGKWSVLVYNINFVSIGLMTVFAMSFIPAFYPGSNIQLSFLLALIIVLPTSLVFAMLSVAMPRSGGDYVYVSRALGPAWGMMSNWNQTVWWILYGGVPSAFFAYYGLTPLLRSLGVLANAPSLITWGDRLSTPTGAFLTGTALIVVLVVIFATGLNHYFRIQNVLFVLAMLGVLLTIILLLTKNPASFQAGFNHSLSKTAGTADPYRAVMAAAKKDGFTTAPFSLYWTVIPITWIYLELVFNQSSAYIGGEVRRPGRVQIWSMPIAAVVTTGAAMLLVWMFQRTAGTKFLGALSFDNGASLHFSTAPTYTELASYATRNAVLAFLLCFGFIFWSYSWLPGQILNASRNLLAYGIDGVMPSWFSNVSERRHTPVNALAIMGLGSIAALWFYTRPDSPFKTLTGIFGFILSFCLTSIAAIVLPYRQRKVWQDSPVNWQIGRIPVMSIVGAASLLAAGFMGWVYLHDPLSGISWKPTGGGGILFGSASFDMFLLDIAILLSGLVIYLIARAVQRRRGVDLDATYQEIPAE